MTALTRYEAAKSALAEARSVDEVKDIRDKAEAMALYQRIAGDHGMEADAAEIRERAERRLGELLIAAKAAGQIARGQPKKNPSETEEYSRVKLADVGIDHKLSSRAQKKAGIAERAYEAMLERMRDEIISGKRVADVLRVEPINGARSIMGSRQEPDDSLDYFPTPPWATRALIEHVLPKIGIDTRKLGSVWEPACGEGHIAEVLREYCPVVHATDIFDYGYGEAIQDFLHIERGDERQADWVITNPPFDEAALKFVLQARKVAREGVAMFFRSQWAVEGIERYETIFRDHPPTLCAFFVERVNLCKGRWDPDGSTATAYCWLVWHKLGPPRPIFWIPPGCRESLTRPDDVARFTAHPVIRKAHRPIIVAGTPCDATTGEVIEQPDSQSPVPQPAQGESEVTNVRGSGASPHDRAGADAAALDVPAFLHVANRDKPMGECT